MAPTFEISTLDFPFHSLQQQFLGRRGKEWKKSDIFSDDSDYLSAKPATYFINSKLQSQMLNLTALLITLFTGEVEGAKMRAWTELECEEEGRYKVIWLKKQFEAKLIKCKTRTCKTHIQSWNDSDSTFLPEWIRTRVLNLTVGIQSTDLLCCSKFCC